MIRSTLKRGLKRVLGREKPPPARSPVSPSAPVYASAAAPHEDPASADEELDEAPAEEREAAPGQEAAPEQEAEQEAAPEQEAEQEAAAPEEAAAEPTDDEQPAADTAGPPILFEEVQEILDEMVRPALQMDGGDITLLKIEGQDIHVKLVGACSTCPSSIMTMKMGVEALLKEEFPQMNELVHVD